jgi:hypothetical protein
MGVFDKDPKYRRIKTLRDSGDKGPVDQDGDKAKVIGTGRDCRIVKRS